MPGIRSIAMKSIRTTILTSKRNRSWAPRGPPFVKCLIFILGKNVFNQNDVEFDLTIGHAHVLFSFFLIKTKNVWWTMYFRDKTLFLLNLMIIIKGTFRNTPNYIK